jgi:TPR repeat protein
VPGEQPAAAPATGPAPRAASALRIQPEGPPVPLARSQLSPDDRDRALKMLQRGNDLIANKDFSAAQHFYKRAAEIGLAEAALALARTYDPGEIARIGAVGLRPNLEMARTWYEKARGLGSREAEEYLLRLSAVR